MSSEREINEAERKIRAALYQPDLTQAGRASILTNVLSELSANQTREVVEGLRASVETSMRLAAVQALDAGAREARRDAETILRDAAPSEREGAYLEREASAARLINAAAKPERADVMERLRVISRLPKQEQPAEINKLLDRERAREEVARIDGRLEDLRSDITRLDEKLTATREDMASKLGVRIEWLDTFGTLLACFGAPWGDTGKAIDVLERAFHLGSLRPSERLRQLAAIGRRLPPSTTDRSAYARSLSKLIAHHDQHKSFDLVTSHDGRPRTATLEGAQFFSLYALALARAHSVAEWTRTGHNVFELTHALAVGLALTDPPDDAVESSPLPYPAMVFRLPPGVLPFRGSSDGAAEQLWVDTLWVVEYESEADEGDSKPSLVTVRQREIVVLHGGAAEDGDPAADGTLRLYGSEAARNIVSNFLLWLEATGGQRAHKQDKVPPRLAAKRERSGETWPREWVFGREVKIAPEMKRAAAEGRSVSGWKVRARFIVRGHWRNQAHGPRRAERTRRWIQPHWRGPVGEAAWSHLYVAGND